jgi:hypothetical protein
MCLREVLNDYCAMLSPSAFSFTLCSLGRCRHSPRGRDYLAALSYHLFQGFCASAEPRVSIALAWQFALFALSVRRLRRRAVAADETLYQLCAE